MKKILALLLAAVMLCAVPVSLAEEKINLTAFQYALENQNTDFNNLWFFDELEAKTGVHVDFRMVKDADWETQLNLMFSSGDLPDMILRHTVDVEEYGVTQGLLLPLDEYLTEEIMPNYMSRLNINNAGDSIPASDGKTYYIGYLMAQNVNHEGTWYVNTAEMEKLGITEAPKTIDEVTEMLRAMKADGIEYPLSASYSQFGPERIWNQFSSFGVPENTYYYYIDEDNTVKFTAAQDGWRACVEWLHLLYEEGLLDPESLTQDSNLWANKVNDGQVGYFTYLRLINTAIAAENVGNFKSILPPVAEGYEACVSSILEVPTAGAYLTKDCKDPVAALKWIDAQLETETMMVALNGKVGEQIQLNAEGKYEVIDIPENNGLYSFVPVTMGQFFAPGDYYTAIYQMAPHRVERYEDSKAYAEAGVLEYKSFQYLRDLSKMNNEDAIEAANLYTELKSCVEEFFVDFVKNGVTDESWSRFQETTKAIGAERYIELYQNAYNEYLAK